MKNTYIIPSLKVITINVGSILSGSVSSDKGINYGGKDTGGTHTPSSLEFEFEEDDFDETYY